MWLIFFAVLAILFGFIIAFPIGLFIYFKFAGNSSWFRSLIISVAFTVVIYLSFNVLMRAKLFKGIIFGDLFIF